jgi:lipopolysaccharide export system permease protein
MKVLTRYILKAHVGPFLFAFLALTGVILVNTLAKQFANLAGKGLELGVILHFFVLSLPSNVALTFPMAVLVAVLYTFSQIAAENEVTALKANGVDLKRMVMPLVLAATLLTGTMIWFNDRILPESNHRWRQLMVDVGRKTPMLTLREDAVNAIQSGDGRSRYYLQAARIHPTTNRLEDVVIYDVSVPGVGRTIFADSGSMAFNEAQTDMLLRLYDGHLQEVSFDEPENFQRLFFEEQLLRLVGVGTELERTTGSQYRSDREMTIGMLRDRVAELREQHAATRSRLREIVQADMRRVLGHEATDEDVPFSVSAAMRLESAAEGTGRVAREIRTSTERLRHTERQIREYQVEIHKKYSIAAASLIFVLIGAPLALRFPRGGVGMVIAISLAVFALYYVGLIGGETLADEGYVHPTVAMWVVNALMGVVGLYGMARLGREGSTTRGGGESLARLARRLTGARP